MDSETTSLFFISLETTNYENSLKDEIQNLKIILVQGDSLCKIEKEFRMYTIETIEKDLIKYIESNSIQATITAIPLKNLKSLKNLQAVTNNVIQLYESLTGHHSILHEEV